MSEHAATAELAAAATEGDGQAPIVVSLPPSLAAWLAAESAAARISPARVIVEAVRTRRAGLIMVDRAMADALISACQAAIGGELGGELGAAIVAARDELAGQYVIRWGTPRALAEPPP